MQRSLFFIALIVFISCGSSNVQSTKEKKELKRVVLSTSGTRPDWVDQAVTVKDYNGEKMILFTCMGSNKDRAAAMDLTKVNCQSFAVKSFQSIMEQEIFRLLESLNIKDNTLVIHTKNVQVSGMMRLEVYFEKVSKQIKLESADMVEVFEIYNLMGLDFKLFVNLLEEMKKKTIILLDTKKLTLEQAKLLSQKIEEIKNQAANIFNIKTLTKE